MPKAPDATCYFRVTLPSRGLAALGHEVRARYPERVAGIKDGELAQDDDIAWADIIVVQRPITSEVLGAVRRIKKRFTSKPLVGDYDDDYATVPRWNPGFGFVKANEESWRALTQEMDGIVVSTYPLGEAIESRYAGPVEVIPNGFDFDTLDAAPEGPLVRLDAVRLGPKLELEKVYPVASDAFNELMRDRVVVCWAGSRHHYADLDLLARDVPQIMREHPEVTLLFVGYVQGNVLRGAEMSRVFTCPPRFPTPAFHVMLRGLKIDIMLAPLATQNPTVLGVTPAQHRAEREHTMRFNSAKSNLKVMEAMAIGAYPVCSRLDPYQDDLDFDEIEDIEPGDLDRFPRQGRLVNYSGKGAWAAGIKDALKVVSDPVSRERMRRENAEYVRARHAAPLRAQAYESFFTRLMEAKR